MYAGTHIHTYVCLYIYIDIYILLQGWKSHAMFPTSFYDQGVQMQKNSHPSNTFIKSAAHKSKFLAILLVDISKQNILCVESLNSSSGH